MGQQRLTGQTEGVRRCSCLAGRKDVLRVGLLSASRDIKGRQGRGCLAKRKEGGPRYLS